jgi:hypothetical protein
MSRRWTAWRRWSNIVKRCLGANSEEAERSAETDGAVRYSVEGGKIEEISFGVVRFLFNTYTRTCALLDASGARGEGSRRHMGSVWGGLWRLIFRTCQSVCCDRQP